MLTPDQILAADDLKRERVDVPEWGAGAFVYVRTMTGTERDEFEVMEIEARKRAGTSTAAGIRGRLAAFTICDENGARLFEGGHAEALGRKSAAAMSRIFDAAARLNRITASDVQELEKN